MQISGERMILKRVTMERFSPNEHFEMFPIASYHMKGEMQRTV